MDCLAESLQASSNAALELGAPLGSDLKITGILGEGGTAIVYSAFHRVLAREVAVKLCTVRGPHLAEAQMRLIYEAKMCASVRDPRVPRIYGLDRLEDGTPYLVMEKVTGEALSRTLRRWRVPVRYACDALSNLLDTLDSVHRAGLVHRDLKPSNLLVDLRPEATRPLHLIDFGIAKTIQPDREYPEITRHGTLVGTPQYMAPEQIAGHADARSDIYSAGIVFYEMLAGSSPWAGQSVTGMLASILCEPIPKLQSLRPGLPSSVSAVVEKATARVASSRFQSAREMRAALARATSELVALGPRAEFEALALVQPDEGALATTERVDHEAHLLPTVTAVPRRAHAPRSEGVTHTKTMR